MLNIYLFYQLAQPPLHAMARSWLDRGFGQILARVRRGAEWRKA